MFLKLIHKTKLQGSSGSLEAIQEDNDSPKKRSRSKSIFQSLGSSPLKNKEKRKKLKSIAAIEEVEETTENDENILNETEESESQNQGGKINISNH